mgnify:CR=1 FL=1
MIAATVMTGFATSVIGCGAEAGIDCELSPEETPDGRPGVSQARFTALYNVLFGEARGPRFGSFVALYGVAETRALIARALSGELAAGQEAIKASA